MMLLNVKCKNVKLGENSDDLGCSDNFSDVTVMFCQRNNQAGLY